MAMEYTEEQLNNIDKATLVQLFLVGTTGTVKGYRCKTAAVTGTGCRTEQPPIWQLQRKA